MVWFPQMMCYNVYIPLLIRQGNDVEENPGPTVFDIIDPTTTLSADSSFYQLIATVIDRSRFIYTSINIKVRRRETGLSAIKQSLTLLEISKHKNETIQPCPSSGKTQNI